MKCKKRGWGKSPGRSQRYFLTSLFHISPQFEAICNADLFDNTQPGFFLEIFRLCRRPSEHDDHARLFRFGSWWSELGLTRFVFFAHNCFIVCWHLQVFKFNFHKLPAKSVACCSLQKCAACSLKLIVIQSKHTGNATIPQRMVGAGVRLKGFQSCFTRNLVDKL